MEGCLLRIDEQFRLQLGAKLRELSIRDEGSRHRDRAISLYLDGLKLNPRNTRCQVDLCQLKLDYQIFWHAEHEILFTQEHVLNVLIKVAQFLI